MATKKFWAVLQQRDHLTAVGLRGLPGERQVGQRARSKLRASEFTEREDVTHGGSYRTFASSASFFTRVGLSATIWPAARGGGSATDCSLITGAGAAP